MLIRLVHLVYLVKPDQLDELNKPDRLGSVDIYQQLHENLPSKEVLMDYPTYLREDSVGAD